MPYAGLLFVVLVAWMLIDRFVATSREIEAINRELEQRVTASGAQLVRALEADAQLEGAGRIGEPRQEHVPRRREP